MITFNQACLNYLDSQELSESHLNYLLCHAGRPYDLNLAVCATVRIPLLVGLKLLKVRRYSAAACRLGDGIDSAFPLAKIYIPHAYSTCYFPKDERPCVPSPELLLIFIANSPTR